MPVLWRNAASPHLKMLCVSMGIMPKYISKDEGQIGQAQLLTPPRINVRNTLPCPTHCKITILVVIRNLSMSFQCSVILYDLMGFFLICFHLLLHVVLITYFRLQYVYKWLLSVIFRIFEYISLFADSDVCYNEHIVYYSQTYIKMPCIQHHPDNITYFKIS